MPSSCLLANLSVEFLAAVLLLWRGMKREFFLFIFFLSVQTSRIIADEDRQEALEFSREAVVMLAASLPS